MREVYWIGDRFIVEWEVEKEELGEEEEEKRIKEELKVNWERIMNDIKKDYLED